MKLYEFLIFIFIDTVIHYFVVKWEVKTNPELFKDIELGIRSKYEKK